MIKVSSVVNELLLSSDTALEAMRLGILNFSAFADQIHNEVEKKTFKPVKRGTIIVALSRISEELKQIPALKPKVLLEELSIKAPLCDITFEKTKENLRLTKSLSHVLPETNSYFFTVTQGIDEITIIASEGFKDKIIEHYNVLPKSQYSDLVGINVRFGEEYIVLPNVIFAILHSLAIKRINLIEIVSTYTELTIVIEKENVDIAINQLNLLFRRAGK